jgi:hypothetical protein
MLVAITGLFLETAVIVVLGRQVTGPWEAQLGDPDPGWPVRSTSGPDGRRWFEDDHPAQSPGAAAAVRHSRAEIPRPRGRPAAVAAGVAEDLLP